MFIYTVKHVEKLLLTLIGSTSIMLPCVAHVGLQVLYYHTVKLVNSGSPIDLKLTSCIYANVYANELLFLYIRRAVLADFYHS